MASAENAAQTQPTCPVCHQTDKVQTTQAAYNSGVALAAPPDMPVRQVSMMRTITGVAFLVGIFIFLIIVFIGGLENSFPWQLQLALAIATLVSIITALVVSYFAFQRVVRGDAETTQRLPAWDKAMTTWRALYYCGRDNVVFDPKTNKTISTDELTKLRAAGQAQDQEKAAAAVPTH